MEEKKRKTWTARILHLDVRIVYLFVFAVVILPFFFKPVLGLKTTKWVKSTFDIMEEAAVKGKPVMIGFDYDPSSLAELQPMATAFLRHAFSRNIKVVGINFNANGTALAATTMDEVAKEYGKKYGEDYVFMGYLPQWYIVIQNIGDNIRKPYQADYKGQAINDIPMLKSIQNYNDFHLVICIAGTKVPTDYIIWGVNQYNFNFAAGLTAVSAAEYYPYLQSGQLKGLLAGMKAAAEYEGLISKPDSAMRGMASQEWGHLTIIAFIIIGNILFYLRKKMKSEGASNL